MNQSVLYLSTSRLRAEDLVQNTKILWYYECNAAIHERDTFKITLRSRFTIY